MYKYIYIYVYVCIYVYMYKPILGQLVTILVQDFKVETESLKNGTHFVCKELPLEKLRTMMILGARESQNS